jgi:hypothetical protein
VGVLRSQQAVRSQSSRAGGELTVKVLQAVGDRQERHDWRREEGRKRQE